MARAFVLIHVKRKKRCAKLIGAGYVQRICAAQAFVCSEAGGDGGEFCLHLHQS